jgi:NADP-dependent 3-hydroxy acid dehydrogenase YdfG/acyl carrier protein
LGLWAFRKNVSFFAIDLGGLMTEKPAVMTTLLNALSRYTDEALFHPLPHRVFPVSRAVDAFRHMAQAKHIGKIVISMQDDHVAVAPLEKPVTFRPDVTYLITGGFGGLGITLADWIVEHGGRHVVLMGRSGASSESAQQALAALQRTGAQVMAAQADVGDAQQVADVLADIDRTMPPLGGIFHAAMVLDDSMILQLNPERFRSVMAPKVEGAWNLHTQTLDCPLDFFVLFSSMSSLVGNQGQGNYVAANAFFDTFASYRRSLGLPAMTINWGQVTEVGYVSRHQEVVELLTRRGLLGFSPKQAMAALGLMLQRQPVQMGVMRIDWQKIAMSVPGGAIPQRLSSLASSGIFDQQGGEEGSRIREALLHASPEEQEAIVQAYIREQVARVLGASADALDADQTLNELGLDSLMGVELKNRVESDLSITVPMRDLMAGPTINLLTTVLLNQLGMSSATPSAAAVSSRSRADEASAQLDKQDEVSAMVDQLSDAEVDALLQEVIGEEASQNTSMEEET